MAQPGLLEWANSIRSTMINDRGRQFFNHQVDIHGFLFLENYFEGILDGPREQDPIIDLIKTPGRKKVAPAKQRVANSPSKLKYMTSVSLEDGEDGKENTVPVNRFHKTLLQAKEEKDSTSIRQSPRATGTITNSLGIRQMNNVPSVEVTQISPGLTAPDLVHAFISPTSPPSLPPAPGSHEAYYTTLKPEFLAPSYADENNLSVIAEGNESVERSLASIQVSPLQPTISPKQDDKSLLDSDPIAQNGIGKELIHLKTSPIENSRSITSDPSLAVQPAHELSAPMHRLEASPHLTDTCTLEQPSQSIRLFDNLTTPLPEILRRRHLNDHQADVMTAPLPVLPSLSSTSAPTVSTASPPRTVTHLSSVPIIPALPAPQPLRMSIRAPRDTSAGYPLTTATPGAPLGGKRTSWLQKAREFNAMKETGHRISAVATKPPSLSDTGRSKRKSGNMFAHDGLVELGMDEEGDRRKHKVAKLDSLIVPKLKHSADDLKLVAGPQQSQLSPQPSPKMQSQQRDYAIPTKHLEQNLVSTDDEGGMLDRFKKTVEGLGARLGKSTGKSLGGPAAAMALAEARAAAEARVAEREMTTATRLPGLPIPEAIDKDVEQSPVAVAPSIEVETHARDPLPMTGFSAGIHEAEWRLSVSDLTSYKGGSEERGKAPGKLFQMTPRILTSNTEQLGDESLSTTPPCSPPATRPSSFVLPSGPVFNKPQPVFVAPPPIPTVEAAILPTAFSLPSNSLGLASLPSPTFPSQIQPPALSAQSTVESIKSDSIFDTKDDVPAWMPSTQDTEYSSVYGSQGRPRPDLQELDEDDSWPIDEKLAAGAHWTFDGGLDDSMTRSTLPPDSHKTDIGPVMSPPMSEANEEQERFERDPSSAVQRALDEEDEYDDDEIDLGNSEMDVMEININKPTVSLVGSKVIHSQNQISSMSSSASSQTNPSFFGQATKLMSSMLGTSKKGKPEVKSLQLAAAVAKKQQEEKDKKAARLKEMENRRQLALQRKAEEEKTRALDEERKIKEEGEKRKREREEYTDKRPIKGTTKKEEDNTKKRKIIAETEKNSETKKTAPKPINASTSKATTTFKPAIKQPVVLTSSSVYNSQQTSSSTKADTLKAAKAGPTSSTKGNSKAVAKGPIPDDDLAQPAQVLQNQMAARAKAHLHAAKQAAEPSLPSESIELPDIDSEYSDSEDEDRPRSFDPPEWAQSPELRQTLQLQSTINPDDIFGAIRPLRMEEIFRTRASRFRSRTSSANWTGTDRLTADEEREYVRRMGFR